MHAMGEYYTVIFILFRITVLQHFNNHFTFNHKGVLTYILPNLFKCSKECFTLSLNYNFYYYYTTFSLKYTLENCVLLLSPRRHGKTILTMIFFWQIKLKSNVKTAIEFCFCNTMWSVDILDCRYNLCK